MKKIHQANYVLVDLCVNDLKEQWRGIGLEARVHCSEESGVRHCWMMKLMSAWHGLCYLRQRTMWFNVTSTNQRVVPAISNRNVPVLRLQSCGWGPYLYAQIGFEGIDLRSTSCYCLSSPSALKNLIAEPIAKQRKEKPDTFQTQVWVVGLKKTPSTSHSILTPRTLLTVAPSVAC